MGRVAGRGVPGGAVRCWKIVEIEARNAWKGTRHPLNHNHNLNRARRP